MLKRSQALVKGIFREIDVSAPMSIESVLLKNQWLRRRDSEIANIIQKLDSENFCLFVFDEARFQGI